MNKVKIEAFLSIPTCSGGVNLTRLLDEIEKEYGDKVCYIPKDRFKEEIPSQIKEGDIVLGLGAGDINIVMEEVIREFDKNRATT